jgi:hypothetical protein
MSDYAIRPYDKTRDEDWVLPQWIGSVGASRFGLATKQHDEARRRAQWESRRAIVQRLLDTQQTMVAVTDADSALAVGIAFACFDAQSDRLVHYVSVRHSHQRAVGAEVVRALLGERLERACGVTFDPHELRRDWARQPEAGRPICVRHWYQDPYRLAEVVKEAAS